MMIEDLDKLKTFVQSGLDHVLKRNSGALYNIH